MEFSPGAIILDDIIGGTLQVGNIPNARLTNLLETLANSLGAGGVVPTGMIGGKLGIFGGSLFADGTVWNGQLDTEIRALANALSASGEVPHSKLTGELVTLANALTAGGKVPNNNLASYLNQLANALASGGIVPYSKLNRTGPYGENPGNVTLLGGETTIITLDCGTVADGTRIFVWGNAIYTRQAGANGDVTIGCKKSSGTATIGWYDDATQADFTMWDVAAGEVRQGQYSAIGRVTGTGTLVLKHYGYSSVANSIVGLGNGQAYAWVFET